MNLLVIKKMLLVIALLFIGISITTCKKISKYPIRLNGVWYAPQSPCGSIITISAGGFGSHESTEDRGGCSNSRGKGKVKISNHNLYLGVTNFKIISKPTLYSSNDSITLPGRFQNGSNYIKGKIYAVMTLKNNFFNSSTTFKYYKIIEY